MDVNAPLDRITNPDNLVDKLANTTANTSTEITPSLTTGNELFQDLGDVYGGRIIAPSVDSAGSEPTSTDFSGSFLSGDLQTMPDGTQSAWLGRVNSGVVDFSVGDSGIYQNRLTNGYEHIADDGTTYRKGLLGMTALSGRTAPSFGLGYENDAPTTNLLTNPGFETGDFTGWTAVAGTWSAEAYSYEGTYSARAQYSGAGAVPEKYQVVALDGTVDYIRMSGTMRNTVGYNSTIYQAIKITLEFYATTDGTGSLLSSYSISHPNNVDGVWFSQSAIIAKPATCQSVKVRLLGTDSFSSVGGTVYPYTYWDALILEATTPSNYLGFEPDSGKVVSYMIDADYEIGQVPVGAMTVPRVEETKDKLTAAQGTTDPAALAVGTYNYITTFVDTYGETDADLAQYTALTIATEAKRANLSAIPLGKWGTTARRIYRSNSTDTADATAYKLVTTIADNTTTTYTDTTPTTDLSSTTIPTVNTTGSRPIFPRYADVPAEAFICSTAETILRDVNDWYSVTARQDAPADGQYYEISCMLEAGTYTLKALGRTQSDCAKVDYYLDGVSQSTGQDWYSASTTYTVTKSITLTVATSGYHIIQIRVNGKNGSSSNYYWRHTKVTIAPSAY